MLQDYFRPGIQPCAETDHRNLAATLSCNTVVLGYGATHEGFTLLTTALYAQPEVHRLCVQGAITLVNLRTCLPPSGAGMTLTDTCKSPLLCKDTTEQQWRILRFRAPHRCMPGRCTELRKKRPCSLLRSALCWRLGSGCSMDRRSSRSLASAFCSRFTRILDSSQSSRPACAPHTLRRRPLWDLHDTASVSV